ncbi:MAG TPA: MlaD family protein [Thermoanaerobaculia bacterium]|nr:MlaD family protein [Thermoanaerobaculia bacterium]
MRKLFALLFLVALAAAVWYGGRWFAHKDDVKATIVFRDSGALRKGDPVLEKQVVVGRVSSVDTFDDRKAVTVRLAPDHRKAIVSDSLFLVEGRTLAVVNTFAVGRPVESGAILYAKEDGVSRWLARNGPKAQPYLDQAKQKAGELSKEAPKLKEQAKELWEKVKK